MKSNFWRSRSRTDYSRASTVAQIIHYRPAKSAGDALFMSFFVGVTGLDDDLHTQVVFGLRESFASSQEFAVKFVPSVSNTAFRYAIGIGNVSGEYLSDSVYPVDSNTARSVI